MDEPASSSLNADWFQHVASSANCLYSLTTFFQKMKFLLEKKRRIFFVQIN